MRKYPQAPTPRTNQHPEPSSRDTEENTGRRKMLMLLKDQILSLLKSMVVMVKQGKSLDGFISEVPNQASRDSKSASAVPRTRDVKGMYVMALRGLQAVRSEEGVQEISTVVVGVLQQLGADVT